MSTGVRDENVRSGGTCSRSAHRRALLLTALLALAGILTSLGFWQALRRHEEEQSSRMAEAIAEGLDHELEARLEGAISAARALAGFWGAYRFSSRARWAYDSELYAQSNGFASVARVDPGTGAAWIATPHEALAPTAVSPDDAKAVEAALRRSARRDEEVTVGPFPIERGGHALWVVFPVHYPDRGPELLVATLALESLFEKLLTGRAPGYALSLTDGENELYRRGVPAPGARAVNFTIEFPSGMAWRGVVQATATLVTRETTPLPEIVLAAGIAISALLAGSAWLAHVARGRTRSLSEANRQINREVALTRSAEADLRKLNAELEARVADRTTELEEVVGELEAFTYSVSHDLRSPLGAVVNFASILEEDYRDTLDPQGRDYLGRISSSAHSALELMDGLLTFSRLGRDELKCSRVDVQALASDVAEELEAIGSAKNVRIELGTLPPVEADPAMLRVVFSNLLSNALKFSRVRDRPRVDIDASESRSEIVYRVKDNGVGFDPRLAHKLFSVFERLHPKEQFEGSGIGLATAARIVRRHGGRIWAENEPGEGATFCFSLPKGEEPEANATHS